MIEKKFELDAKSEVYNLPLASTNRASNWINALCTEQYGFSLTITEFRDGLTIRYERKRKAYHPRVPMVRFSVSLMPCILHSWTSKLMVCETSVSTAPSLTSKFSTRTRRARKMSKKPTTTMKTREYQSLKFQSEKYLLKDPGFCKNNRSSPTALKVMTRLYADVMSYIETKVDFCLLTDALGSVWVAAVVSDAEDIVMKSIF